MKRVALALILALCGGGCTAMAVVPVADPTTVRMEEFWLEPSDLASRDLYWGPWGREHAPDPDGPWLFIARDSAGYSRGFDVKDARGREWSVKVGEEAQSEVVSSRLMWALGYHQPPVYYVARWTLSGDTGWAGPKEPARFRPQLPQARVVTTWSWHQSPFTGTQPWRGALVMMALLNNSDLKSSNNTVYELDSLREGARRWYVVRDLGLSLGETGTLFPKRNDIEKFEKQGFVLGVEGGRVKFDYTGRWQELFRDLTPADVRWTCERLGRISPPQWQDVFRAAGYGPELAERFMRRLQQKIAQGTALPDAPPAPSTPSTRP